jgi:hydrogenase maturation protease
VSAPSPGPAPLGLPSRLDGPAPLRSASRVLVAGVGNVFLGDDGFGVQVARRLADASLPDGVRVADYGIRAVHLAYDLLDGYDILVLVDALARGDAPGTLYVIEPDGSSPPSGSTVMDAHGMTPDAVLGLFATLGGRLDRTLVIGCEPADCSEGMELSGPVAAAVEPAVALVHDLLAGSARSPTEITTVIAGRKE